MDFVRKSYKFVKGYNRKNIYIRNNSNIKE